jgi:RNA polymerase sigma factor (TIGR02999 family)
MLGRLGVSDVPRLVNKLTQVLESVERGGVQAAELLLPLVYEELRRLAAHKLANEAAGQTLQPTALVHEAWLRLAGGAPQSWNGRGHFFAAAAEAMRRILIDNARRRQAARHGGGSARTGLTDLDLAAPQRDERLLDVHEALDGLQKADRVAAELVKLRCFVGMTMPEAAQALNLPLRSAERLWAYARAWLRRELEAPPE